MLEDYLFLANLISPPKILSFASPNASRRAAVNARSAAANTAQQAAIKARAVAAAKVAAANAAKQATIKAGTSTATVPAPPPTPAPAPAPTPAVAPAPAAPTSAVGKRKKSTKAAGKPDVCSKGYPCGIACIEKIDRCYDGIGGPETKEGRALNVLSNLIKKYDENKPKESTVDETTINDRNTEADIKTSLKNLENLDPTKKKIAKRKILDDLASRSTSMTDPTQKKRAEEDYESVLNAILNGDDPDDVDILNEEFKNRNFKPENLGIGLFDKLEDTPDLTALASLPTEIQARYKERDAIKADIEKNINPVSSNLTKDQETFLRDSLLRTYNNRNAFDVNDPVGAEAELGKLDQELTDEKNKFKTNPPTGTLEDYENLRLKALGISIRGMNARGLDPLSSNPNPDPADPKNADSIKMNKTLDKVLGKFTLKKTEAGLYFEDTSLKRGKYLDKDGNVKDISRAGKILSPKGKGNPLKDVANRSQYKDAITKPIGSKIFETVLNAVVSDPNLKKYLSTILSDKKGGGQNLNIYSPLERSKYKYKSQDGNTTFDDVTYEVVPSTSNSDLKFRAVDNSKKIPKLATEDVIDATGKKVKANAEYTVTKEKNPDTLFITSSFMSSSDNTKSVSVPPVQDLNGTLKGYRYNTKSGEYTKVYDNNGKEVEVDITGTDDTPINGEVLKKANSDSQRNFYSKYKGKRVRAQEINLSEFLGSIETLLTHQINLPATPTPGQKPPVVAKDFGVGYDQKRITNIIKDFKELTPTAVNPTSGEKIPLGDKLSEITSSSQYKNLVDMLMDADPEGANALVEQMLAVSLAKATEDADKDNPVSVNLVNTIDGSPAPRLDVMVSDKNTNYSISVKRGDGAQADISASIDLKNNDFINFKNSGVKRGSVDTSKPQTGYNRTLATKIKDMATPGAIKSKKNIFSNSEEYDETDITKDSSPIINVDKLYDSAGKVDPVKVQEFKQSLGLDPADKSSEWVDKFVTDITDIDQIMRSSTVTSEQKENLITDVVTALSSGANSALGKSGIISSFNDIAFALFANRYIQKLGSDPTNVQFNNGIGDETIEEGNYEIVPTNFSTYESTEFNFRNSDGTLSENANDWVVDPGSADLPYRADRGPFQYKNDNPSNSTNSPNYKTTPANKIVKLKGNYKDSSGNNIGVPLYGKPSSTGTPAPLIGYEYSKPIKNKSTFLDFRA